MSKIIITRSSEFTNRLRTYTIYLDDQKIGTIANGDVKTFEVPPGVHRLACKLDWCRSRDLAFTLAEGETQHFRVAVFKGAKILMPLALLVIVANFILRKTAGINYLLWLLVPGFLLLLYFLTLGRKDYLRLEKTNSW